MPDPEDPPLPPGPASDFAEFCEAEFERRRNSDEDFDESAHRAAMDLVLRKLQRQRPAPSAS